MSDSLTPDYDSNENLGIPAQHRWLGEEGKSHYIPSWYRPHRNLDYMVVHRGEMQGLRIRNVLPWRRWALDEDGHTLSQAAFEEGYMRYLSAYKLPETHDVAKEYIPNVREFVRQKLDVVGNQVDYTHDETREVIKTEKYNEHGELAKEYLDATREVSTAEGAMRQLTKLAREGKISADEFTKQAEELLFGQKLEAEKGHISVYGSEIPEMPKIDKRRRPMTNQHKEKLRLAREAALEASRAKKEEGRRESQDLPPEVNE